MQKEGHKVWQRCQHGNRSAKLEVEIEVAKKQIPTIKSQLRQSGNSTLMLNN